MANPAIEHLNSPPTPKQKRLFEQLVGKKFPAWAIVTRQGCNIAIKEILRQQNLGLVYDSILVPAMAFVVRWRTEVIVEAMSVSTPSMPLCVLCRDSESVHHDGPLSHRKMLEAVKTVDPCDVVDPFMVILTVHRSREIC